MTLDDGENFNLDYAVRSSVECVTPEGELAIHGAPGGCKGYDKPWAISFLRKNQVSFRQCTCEQDKAKMGTGGAPSAGCPKERGVAAARSIATKYEHLVMLGLGLDGLWIMDKNKIIFLKVKGPRPRPSDVASVRISVFYMSISSPSSS